MNTKKYTITLADGTKLEGLELNGNNFIAESAVEDSVFEDNMATVTITDGETIETVDDAQLMSNLVRDGRSWIVVGEKMPQQKQEERIAELEAALNLLLSGVTE